MAAAISLFTLPADAVEARRVTATDLGFQPTERPVGRLVVPISDAFHRNGEGSFFTTGDGKLGMFHDARRRGGDHAKAVIRRLISADDGRTWGKAKTVLRAPKASILQPSVVRLPDGRLGMTYSRLHDRGRAEKWFVTSGDDGLTWSEPIPVSHGECDYMTGAHDRLLRLAGGRLLAIAHGKVKLGRGEYDCHIATFIFTSDDQGATWTNRTGAGLQVPGNPYRKNQGGMWEATAVPLKKRGHLLLYGRTATGWLFESRSEDGGTTWSKPARTGIPNPVAPARLVRVPESDLLLMFRNPIVDMKKGWHGGPRRALAVQVSSDEGRTWSRCRQIEYVTDAKRWFDYPFVLWKGDSLHMAVRAGIFGTHKAAILHYTWSRAEVLTWAEGGTGGDAPSPTESRQ